MERLRAAEIAKIENEDFEFPRNENELNEQLPADAGPMGVAQPKPQWVDAMTPNQLKVECIERLISERFEKLNGLSPRMS